MNIVIVIEMTELEANRIGERFGCEAAPLRWQTQKISSSNKRSKTPGTTAVIMVLTSVVSDPVHCRHSICRRPGVLDRVMEELLLCNYLMRVAQQLVCSKSVYVCNLLPAPAFSSTITIFMRPQMTSQRPNWSVLG